MKFSDSTEETKNMKTLVATLALAALSVPMTFAAQNKPADANAPSTATTTTKTKKHHKKSKTTKPAAAVKAATPATK
jgi:hypothetical protein